MIERLYSRYHQKIHENARKNDILFRVMIEVTYRCNFECDHCYIPDAYKKYGELDTQDMYSILDQLKDMGCLYVGFTGGEPFMRPDMVDIIRYAVWCGFEVIVYTNGSLLTPWIIDALAELRLNKIDITLPGHTEHVFEQVTGVNGSHKAVYEAIHKLQDKHVPLGFKSCVLKSNADEIADIQDFARSLGAQYRVDMMLMPRLNGSCEPFTYRAENPDTEQTICEQKNTDPCQHDRDIEERPGTILFPCGVGRTQAAITPQGELKMCLMIDYPKFKISSQFSVLSAQENQKPENETRYINRNEYSLQEAWERLKKLVHHIQPDENYQCDTCELETYCQWCPAWSWLEHGNFTHCASEQYAWAAHRASVRKGL